MDRRLILRTVVLVLLAFVAPGTCWAEAIEATESTSLFRNSGSFASEELDLGPLAIRLASATACVLAFAVVSIVLLRRFLVRRATTGNGTQTMSIEATLALAHRSSLQVIRLDEHRLVVGCDAGGLRTVLLLPESFSKTMTSVEETDESVATDEHTSDWSKARSQDWEVTKWKPQRPIM